jgi:ketosteroid isomerase-like protein
VIGNIDGDLESSVERILTELAANDSDAVLRLCTPDVTFEFPFLGNHVTTAATFHLEVEAMLSELEGLEFYDLDVSPLVDAGWIIAKYRSRSTVAKTGLEYNQRYITEMQFIEGHLQLFREYFDVGEYRRAFGLRR